jgi:hypothetical protein
MPASYPASAYSPRTKSNRPGIEYDVDAATTLFAEDVSKLDDEVVAVETELLDIRKRVVELVLTDNDTAPTVVDGLGKIYFIVPAAMDGWTLQSVKSHVTTVSSSGAPSFQIYNVTISHDLLSVNSTIDANEKDSETAATAETVNSTYKVVSKGDELRVDCDAIGTGAKGVSIRLTFVKA